MMCYLIIGGILSGIMRLSNGTPEFYGEEHWWGSPEYIDEQAKFDTAEEVYRNCVLATYTIIKEL